MFETCLEFVWLSYKNFVVWYVNLLENILYVQGSCNSAGPVFHVAKCRRKGKTTKSPRVRLAMTNMVDDGKLDDGFEEEFVVS